MVRIFYHKQIAAEVPASALADNTPIYHRELLTEPPEYVKRAWQWQANSLPADTVEGIEISSKQYTWDDILLQLLDSPTIASKRWIYRQYDHQVQNNTVILPGEADAAVIRVRFPQAAPADSKRGVAASTDCNPRYVYLDPYEGAKAAVAEASRNLSCVGADPLAITDNLNFPSPENPVGYWQLALACRGIADACREMNTPVTGGNVSLYNETLDSQGKPQPIYPTPVIGMVGLVPDVTKVCRQGWHQAGDLIYLLGITPSPYLPTLGGSEYLATIHGIVAGKPPVVDFDLEHRVQEACRQGIRQGWINSAHDCAEGGIAVALAECCISGQLGAKIQLDRSAKRLDELLFGEAASRILVSVAPDRQQNWEQYLQEHLANNWEKIGSVTDKQGNLQIVTTNEDILLDVTIINITDRWSYALERRMNS